MVRKRLLRAQRQIPKQFSWVDHRLVRERRLEPCSAEAWALYLFLVTVADAKGCCFSQSVVGPPQKMAALLRRRISWDDGAMRERQRRRVGHDGLR